MFDLTGKRALVTGATGGIGGAIARKLHAQGASVVISGTREEKLQGLADELGERVAIAACNLSDREAVKTLIPRAAEHMGGVDILVNNAGVTRDNLMMRLKDEDWDTVLELNMTSAFLLSRAALKGMMKQRWGRIIGMSSIVGVTGNPGQANYAASKAGMIGMTKSLAGEVASRGITVNCIAPGFIATDMTDALTDDQKSGLLSGVPAGRLGSADEIAAATVFLASEEAGYITGTTMNINGGMANI